MTMIDKFAEFRSEIATLRSSKQMSQEKLSELFCNLAHYFLLDGHFHVNGERKIYLCDVEFYYHEEFEDGIRDWSMYHRNNDKETPDYFNAGQLNAHASGIDITFESEALQYRAAMLVRGFQIDNEDPKGYDKRSTYFYDAILNHGNLANGLTIEWITAKRTGREINKTYRINIPEYRQGEESKWEKVPHEGENTEGNKKCAGSKYKQCMLIRRFHLIR